MSLRGYPLNGKNVPLPEGYIGIVVNEPHKPKLEFQPRTFRVQNSFDSITHWNWDKKVTMNDPLMSALSWIEMSNAVSLFFYDIKIRTRSSTALVLVT